MLIMRLCELRTYVRRCILQCVGVLYARNTRFAGACVVRNALNNKNTLAWNNANYVQGNVTGSIVFSGHSGSRSLLALAAELGYPGGMRLTCTTFVMHLSLLGHGDGKLQGSV